MTRLLSEREFRSVAARGLGAVMGVARSRVAAGPQRPVPRRRPAARTPQPTSTDATFAALVENLLKPQTDQDEWAKAVSGLTTRRP